MITVFVVLSGGHADGPRCALKPSSAAVGRDFFGAEDDMKLGI
jgi:hypothetical protein